MMADSPESSTESLPINNGNEDGNRNQTGSTTGRSGANARHNNDATISATPTPGHNQHYITPKNTGFSRFSRKSRKDTHNSLQAYPGWEMPPESRRPYHSYVHELAEGGWDTLRGLDGYMNADVEDSELAISVLDIHDGAEGYTRHPDIYDEAVLAAFMEEKKARQGVSVRLYLAEQRGGLSSSVIEALGGSLDLDPRFFQWSVRGDRHILSPAQWHRAPYVSIGYGVPKLDTPNRTDAEKFKVSIFIKPDEVGAGWTGIFIFNTHTKVEYSPKNLAQPPSFTSPRPVKLARVSRSFRELYLDTFCHLDLSQAILSPFYCIHFLLRLNYTCWSQVINSIREEDHRIKGISDTTVGHAEEIAKSLSLVRRGGSLGWRGREEPLAVETRSALEEDFTHLVEQTRYLWEERTKMGEIKKRKSEARWTLLTNTFTYVFAPITIVSGIYGMNVAEINGSTPDIWQFFAGIAVLNVIVLLALALSNWIHVLLNHQRSAGLKEVFGFAVGLVKH